MKQFIKTPFASNMQKGLNSKPAFSPFGKKPVTYFWEKKN